MTGSSEQLLPQRAQYVANGIAVGVVSVNPDGGAAGVGHIAFHDDPATAWPALDRPAANRSAPDRPGMDRLVPERPAPDRPGTADA